MEHSTALGFHVIISDLVIASHYDAKEYIDFTLGYHKQSLATKMLEEIERVPYPVVVQKHLEEWHDHLKAERHFQMHCCLYATKSVNVVVPSLVFVNHLGEVEWKCSFCATINSIEATFCGELHKNAVGCGHPREKIRS